MTVLRLADIETRDLISGAEVRFVHTEHMTLAYWQFDAGAPFPDHAHPHEQVVNVIEGDFELTVEGQTMRLPAGSVVVIPPNASHSGRAITACRIIDVFHPVREDYR